MASSFDSHLDLGFSSSRWTERSRSRNFSKEITDERTTIITLFCALVLGSSFSAAQQPPKAQPQQPTQVRYAVKDLGTLKGGTFSLATFQNNGVW